MALTIAHTEGRREFAWRDIVEAMTTVETGTAQNIEYIQEETRAVAIHEAGHAAAGHVYLEKDVLSTRLSIRKRGGSLGHYQSMEKDERFSHFRSRVMGSLIMIARRDGGRARVLRRELAGRQRRRGQRHGDRGARWSGCGRWAPTRFTSSGTPRDRRRGAEARARAPGADRLGDHEPRRRRRACSATTRSAPCCANRDKKRGRGPDPRPGLRHRLRADGHQPGRDRSRSPTRWSSGRSCTATRSATCSTASRLQRPELDLMNPDDVAAGMSEHPPVTPSTDDHAVGAALPKPAAGARSRGRLADASPHAHRFRTATARTGRAGPRRDRRSPSRWPSPARAARPSRRRPGRRGHPRTPAPLARATSPTTSRPSTACRRSISSPSSPSSTWRAPDRRPPPQRRG